MCVCVCGGGGGGVGGDREYSGWRECEGLLKGS